MSTQQHRCMVGYMQDYDYVQELYEGDEVPPGATVWNYCPECGRRHGTADHVEQLRAAERAPASVPVAFVGPELPLNPVAAFLLSEIDRLDSIGFAPRK